MNKSIKMSNKYTIKHKLDEMWVHFNPHTHEYFASDKLLGAVTFTESDGKALMREAGMDNEWKLQLISAKKVTSVLRSTEPAVFDSTH